MQTIEFLKEYRWKANFVFAGALMILCYRWMSDSLLSQMEQPLFLFKERESAYLWLLSSGVPQWISSNTIAAVTFDSALFLFPMLFLLSQRRVFSVLFSILLLFYFMTFNLVTGHHYHSLTGLIVITIPFWFRKEEKFHVAWELARYYLLYIFASAALWKITRGSAFYEPQLSEILKSQQLYLLIQQPDSLHARLVQYLIANVQISHALLLANVVLQLSFVVGFFTKRFDSILFWLAILFCIANYLVMSIFSFELLILNLSLLDWKNSKMIIKSDLSGLRSQPVISNH
ncbi:MAG: hypothetical protein IPP77_03270 [Bacteroidetes bacterium]|nr:hypothetical protein [Bacteroidota bacterium]